jgi:hypothetical protein
MRTHAFLWQAILVAASRKETEQKLTQLAVEACGTAGVGLEQHVLGLQQMQQQMQQLDSTEC